MKNKSTLIQVILVMSLVILFSIIFWKNGSDSTADGSSAPVSVESSLTADSPADSKTNDAKPAVSRPAVDNGGLVEPVLVREELFEVTEADMTPFLKSETAAKWMKELGYTESELVQTQRELRELGFPENKVNDAGIVRRHLPSRHMGRITISEIIVPETAKAGEPIPFTLKGTKPSPSYSFTRFDILVQGNVIRINAKGNSDGDNNAGLGGSVELKGSIDPLPPGEYRIIVSELGPNGTFPFVVE